MQGSSAFGRTWLCVCLTLSPVKALTYKGHFRYRQVHLQVKFVYQGHRVKVKVTAARKKVFKVAWVECTARATIERWSFFFSVLCCVCAQWRSAGTNWDGKCPVMSGKCPMMSGKCPTTSGKCPVMSGKMSWENVQTPTQDYKPVRVAVIPPWLTHTYTDKRTAFDRLYY